MFPFHRLLYSKNITIKNHYPSSHNEDLDSSRGTKNEKNFTKINLNFGYRHVLVDPWYVWKIKSKDGFYKWLLIPFITNTLVNFMHPMNDVQCPFTNVLFVVYINDVLIYIKTCDGNLQHIVQVLKTLDQHKLFVNIRNTNSP